MNSHGRKISATHKKLLALGVEAEEIKERCAGTEALLVEAREHIAMQDRVIADLRGELSMREESFAQLRHVLEATNNELRNATALALHENGVRGIVSRELLEVKKRILQLEEEARNTAKLRRRLFAKSREMEDLRRQLAALRGEVYQEQRNEDMAINFARTYDAIEPSSGG